MKYERNESRQRKSPIFLIISLVVLRFLSSSSLSDNFISCSPVSTQGEKSIICVCLPFSLRKRNRPVMSVYFSRRKNICVVWKRWNERGVQVQVCLLHTRLDKRARMSDNLVRKAWMREKSIDCSRDDLHSFLPPLVSSRCYCCYCRFAFVTWRRTHNKVLPEWIFSFPSFLVRENRMAKVTLTDKNRHERGEDIQFVNSLTKQRRFRKTREKS